jgi:adenylate cyclase
MTEVPSFAPARPASRRQLLVWGLGAVAAVTGAALAGRHFSASTREAPHGAAIAVLPFDNLSVAPEDAYLAAGMSDDLMTALSRVPGIQIAPHASAAALKRETATPRDIGRQLGVGYVLKAGVRAAGDSLRVTAQVISAANGFPVWTGEYHTHRRDVVAVQERILAAIVQSLHLRLADPAAAMPRRPPDPATYDLYLRGLSFRDRQDQTGLNRAVDYFSQVVARDSLFAAAWSRLGNASSLIGILGYARPKEVFPRARAAAIRALALDPEHAEGHASLGMVRLFYDWDWPGTRQALDKAIALDSGNTLAHVARARYFVAVDSVAEAVSELEATAIRDPLSPFVDTQLAFILLLEGRADEAIEHARRAIDLDSTYLQARRVLALDLAWSGRCDEAVKAAQRPPVARDSDQVLATQAVIQAACGRTEEVSQPLRWLEAQRARRYVGPCLIAPIYAALGDAGRTFAWLDTAFVERAGCLLQAKLDPSYRRYRRDPRFRRLLRRMGPVHAGNTDG